VNFGIQPTMAPIHIARALGLIAPIEKKRNVRIVFHMFNSGPPLNSAMAAGELQIGSAGMGPAIVAASRLPATLVAVTVFGQNAILVQKDSPIRTVKDLKGKTIAHPGEGAQQYPMLVKALGDAGLAISDVQLFKTDGSQIPTLLQQKSVDAGITFEPHVSNALLAGHSRLLVTADQIMPIVQGHYVGNGEYVRNDFMARRPDVVQDIVNANVQAIDFILKNPKAAAKMWHDQIGYPVDVIDYSLSSGLSVYLRNITPEKAGIESYVKFLREGKILEAADLPQVDESFARRALAGKAGE
jgi:ABC-type nitrate/sulfonate/bicarbonate transport system substrate-binding protein